MRQALAVAAGVVLAALAAWALTVALLRLTLGGAA